MRVIIIEVLYVWEREIVPVYIKYMYVQSQRFKAGTNINSSTANQGLGTIIYY